MLLRFTIAALLLTGLPLPAQTDVLIQGGRIVDGTGAPWYRGDILVSQGRIAGIGRLTGVGASSDVRIIDATGLVVAPGFIDMMGQTATPLLDDPGSALNLLAQGITTINAGEGASAAPLDEAAGAFRAWTTMAEYFQLLDLRGLPLNVAQTVGHTQVRRLVMGDVNGQPSEEELSQMQALVREGMEAGAIGVSTALIYPPAVYAGTDEIGALAAIAGEHGGRYYTHMRNEGDQLLEAIDEALEIGRKGNTPVHIFHLKAAGEQNWPKMEQAIAKIRHAREEGFQVTADIYPYIHNGLSIPAMIHPRHFSAGWADFLTRLEDPALRETIRAEMEAESGEWENWYQHIGRDWTKLIVGKANSIRYDRYNGQSLAAIAEATEIDPWELFFALVETDAFVLPQSMSDANKHRLMGEPFISFCTDVGPFGGAGSASHPRGFGAFARLFGKYRRAEKVITLERAVAQASAVAANELMAYDRGRLAEGLAADIIVFDEETFQDRATFAQPYEPAEGMHYVLVNGEVVFEEGKQTEALPGRVLRGPGYDPHRAPCAVRTGTPIAALESIDALMRDYLKTHRIPGAALAITKQGKLVYATGFGYADVAKREPVNPESLFRIASISKPITAAAISLLVEQGRLSLEDKVFTLLDGYVPLDEEVEVDPRLAEITISHLLRHQGGWDRAASFDAMFRSVDFAQAAGSPPPADQDEIIINMLAQPLDFAPGERQAYSNFGYCLLGRVIARVSGQEYEDFVKEHVLDPSGARTMRQGRSLLSNRAPGEVRYYSPYRGPSVFAETLGKRVPYPYGGWNVEAMDSHGAWLASVIDLARFAVAFDVPEECPFLGLESLETMHRSDDGGEEQRRRYVAGWGKRMTEEGPVYSHSGSLAGTSTLLVRRPDGCNWVALFNARSGPRASAFAVSLQPLLDEAIDAISEWPEKDLFPEYPGHEPLNP